MWFCPERKQTIKVVSKHQPKGEPEVTFELGGPNPYAYTQAMCASGVLPQPGETALPQDPFDYYRMIVRLCLRSVTPAVDGWEFTDGMFRVDNIREMSTDLLEELANICLDNFLRPPEELSKN